MRSLKEYLINCIIDLFNIFDYIDSKYSNRDINKQLEGTIKLYSAFYSVY